jgi:hypothetical protein
MTKKLARTSRQLLEEYSAMLKDIRTQVRGFHKWALALETAHSLLVIESRRDAEQMDKIIRIMTLMLKRIDRIDQKQTENSIRRELKTPTLGVPK